MAQILRVSILGVMPGGEVWSTNPCWEIDGEGGAPVSPSQALTIATALGAVTPAAAVVSMMAPNTNLTGYKVEARSLTGTLESQAEFLRPTPVLGNGAVSHPHQTAMVLSLRTPGIGAVARGRLYFPATGQTIQSADYRLSSAAATSLLSGLKAYLLNLEAGIKATLPNANLTVWSRSTANFHNVTSLQLGNVLDTQRRRRDALSEGVIAGAYP